MKKLISLALILCMTTMLFAGCGEAATTDAVESTVPETTLGYTLNWPNSALTKRVPRPATDDIKIEYLDEFGMRATVSNVDYKAFEAYCTDVMNAGYEAIMMPENGYVGSLDGWEYGVKFEPEKSQMTLILIRADDEEETEDDSEPMSSEFIEAMDAFEAFIDEYIEFMTMYNESSDTSDLLDEYEDYMNKYSQFMNEVYEFKDNDLNTAELKYYNEFMLRVNQKVLEVLK